MPPPLRRLLLIAFAALVVVAATSARVRAGMVDFEVYVRAGQRILDGQMLYQPTDGHYMFKYLPPSALLFVPFAWLPLAVAKTVWVAISLLALGWSFALVDELVPAPPGRYVLPICAAVLGKYILHELRLGQINIVVMTVMLLGIRALSREDQPPRNASAGLFAGAATALKPYAAVFIPWFVLARNWTAAAVACVALAIALLIPAAIYGLHGNIELLRAWATTLSQSTPGLLTNADNVSVIAFFTKWLGDPRRALIPAAITLAVLALAMLAVIVRGGDRPRKRVLEGAMLMTLVPLASPTGWDYTFVAALPAVALILAAIDAFPKPARVLLAANLTVIGLAIFDLMGRQAYGTFMQWSVTTINFIIVVAALAYLRFRTEM